MVSAASRLVMLGVGVASESTRQLTGSTGVLGKLRVLENNDTEDSAGTTGTAV